MQKNPLVSVYITNYNYAKFIRQSINSILNQTLQDFELFIIDDGSTDNSKDIIEEFATDPKIDIIYQKNKGLNITNNIALRASRGKYIMRLDADDYLDPNALKMMSDIMEKNDELGLVFPDYYLVDASSNLIGEVRRLDFQKEVSLLDQPAHGACTMIRKHFLTSVGGYDESYSCQDGYELWIKFIMHFKVQNINEPLFYYRQHGNNLTTNENRILETRFNIKNNFISNNNIPVPPALAVIPVRNTFIKGKNIILETLGNETVLERAVKTAVAAKNLNHIVVTSSDIEIKNYYDTYLDGISPKLHFIERPPEFSRINESLTKTLNHVLINGDAYLKDIQSIMTIAVEYPFITADVIDDAINTLLIFGADSLVTVRPDNSIYYQHDGTGLKPILDHERFTKLEREAMYKAVGGITLSKTEGFKKESKLLNGKIGHIVIDEKKAMGIFDETGLKLCKLLASVEY